MASNKDLDERIEEALRPLTLSDVFNATDDEKQQIKVNAIKSLIHDELRRFAEELHKKAKEIGKRIENPGFDLVYLKDIDQTLKEFVGGEK